MMKILKSLFWLALTCVLVVFVLQNGSELLRPVELRLNLFVKDLSPGSIPQYGLVLGALLLGFLIGGGWGVIQQLGLRNRLRETQRLLRDRENELDSLRNLPVLEGTALQADSRSQQASGSVQGER